MKELFPSVTRVLSIFPTTAAISASLERANSALQHVKTDFCSMMGEERLNGLLLDYDKIINIYASKYPRRILSYPRRILSYPRRMLLINPLSKN